MSINYERTRYLLLQYAGNVASENEVTELFAIIHENEGDEFFKEWLANELEETAAAEPYDQKKWNRVVENILTSDSIERQPARVIPMWRKIAVAASVLLVVVSGIYYLNLNKTHQSPDTNAVLVKHDVAPPALNRATITLANGQKVFLDSANNGTLAQQGNVSLQKLADGQIVYNGESFPSKDGMNSELVYNTLTNPRGSKVIDMTLSDGTKVWLNAGSSVTYPVAFVGKERKVTMNGEAYFEVVHNTAMPFKVSKGDVEVTVLGTHFNVNAYDDEESIKVTLLEGSVKASKLNSEELILKPGEQAIAMADTKLKVEKNADPKEVMSWKDGKFYFDGADIKTVMRQLSRWYDVEVDYKANINYSFVAKISRDVPVSELLKLLELTGGVHFKVDGKKITVMK